MIFIIFMFCYVSHFYSIFVNISIVFIVYNNRIIFIKILFKYLNSYDRILFDFYFCSYKDVIRMIRSRMMFSYSSN